MGAMRWLFGLWLNVAGVVAYIMDSAYPGPRCPFGAALILWALNMDGD